MTDKFYAWAIDTRSDEGHGFIGRYWYYVSTIPRHMEGCQVALFKTRKIARENLPSVKSSFPEAVVVKVSIVVKEIKI